MGIPFYYLFHCIWTFFGSGGNYLPTVWNQVCMHSLQHASVNVITKVIWNSLLREAFFVCYSVICFPFAICIWFLFGLQYFEDFSKLCNCVITTCNNQAIMCLILYLNVVFLFLNQLEVSVVHTVKYFGIASFQCVTVSFCLKHLNSCL